MAKTLVKTRTGRMVLHLCAACRDLQWRWHMAGVLREFGSSRLGSN
jgi:hypothetical protein